jgi:two-component system LytT family response regulator
VINCIIIDDEPLALDLLESYIQKVPFLNPVGKFEEPLQALSLLNKEQVNLLFLDIRMPDISGVDFFRSLSQKPNVIFTSAYSEFAINGFELNAIDYLLKPISFEKFLLACNKVKDLSDARSARLQKNKEYFFINVAHKLHKIFYADILYLEGLKDYTKIYLAGSSSPMLILHNLKYFEDLLDETEFSRIHRSYIVSISKLDTISRKHVTINNETIPVSDNYRDDFFAIVSRCTT